MDALLVIKTRISAPISALLFVILRALRACFVKDRNDETLGRVVMLQHEIIVTRPLLLMKCKIHCHVIYLGMFLLGRGDGVRVIQLSTNMYTLYLR